MRSHSHRRVPQLVRWLSLRTGSSAQSWRHGMQRVATARTSKAAGSTDLGARWTGAGTNARAEPGCGTATSRQLARGVEGGADQGFWSPPQRSG